MLQGDYLRAKLRLPRVSPQPWRPKLAYASAAERQEVEATANRLLCQWEAAGSPGLTRAIERTQQLIHSARVAAEERRIARKAVEQHLLKGGFAWRA